MFSSAPLTGSSGKSPGFADLSFLCGESLSSFPFLSLISLVLQKILQPKTLDKESSAAFISRCMSWGKNKRLRGGFYFHQGSFLRQLGKWRMDEGRGRCHGMGLKAIIGNECNSIMMSKAISKTLDE